MPAIAINRRAGCALEALFRRDLCGEMWILKAGDQ
jgi:hypothetical protein